MNKDAYLQYSKEEPEKGDGPVVVHIGCYKSTECPQHGKQAYHKRWPQRKPLDQAYDGNNRNTLDDQINWTGQYFKEYALSCILYPTHVW